MSELKPCPFCGGEAISQLLDAGTVDINQLEQNVVACDNCDFNIYRCGEGDDAAEILWNTRA